MQLLMFSWCVTLTLLGGGKGLLPEASISDVIEDMLSVDRPFDNLLFGAGGGGFCGLFTNPNLSAFLQSAAMTSLLPVNKIFKTSFHQIQLQLLLTYMYHRSS